eukprot:6786943-Pyramimonas_sp.AAC.1
MSQASRGEVIDAPPGCVQIHPLQGRALGSRGAVGAGICPPARARRCIRITRCPSPQDVPWRLWIWTCPGGAGSASERCRA